MEEVLETTLWVVERSHHVQLERAALEGFAEKLVRERPPIPQWDYRYHFFDGGERTVGYLLVLDSLNFCFWAPPGQPRWTIQYGGERLSGYFALAAALKRAVEGRESPLRADYLARLTLEDLKRMLGGEGQLQLLDRRRAILNELGRVLLESYSGRAAKLVEAAGGSAVELARLLARKLSSFQDVALYGGRKIHFYKRAQLFAADLWGAFQGVGFGRFADIAKLTAFADYKLPQVLRHLGILRYSAELAARIDRQELIPAGSPEEVEIRANTIWAVELLKGALAERGWKLSSVELDWLLWGLGQREGFKEKPYHRTVTIFY